MRRRDRVAAADALGYLNRARTPRVPELLALAEMREAPAHVRSRALASIPADAVASWLSRLERLAEDADPEVAAAARGRIEAGR